MVHGCDHEWFIFLEKFRIPHEVSEICWLLSKENINDNVLKYFLQLYNINKSIQYGAVQYSVWLEKIREEDSSLIYYK